MGVLRDFKGGNFNRLTHKESRLPTNPPNPGFTAALI